MATFGETLKRERELRKISLREVSESTKIGLRYLEALEANRFDQLPGGLFNKGFIRAYANFIGLDAESLVNAYLFDIAKGASHEAAPRPYTGLRFEEPSPPCTPVPEEEGPRFRRWMGLGIALAGGLALIGGWWWLSPLRSPSGDIEKAPPDAVTQARAGELTSSPLVDERTTEPTPSDRPATQADSTESAPRTSPAESLKDAAARGASAPDAPERPPESSRVLDRIAEIGRPTPSTPPPVPPGGRAEAQEAVPPPATEQVSPPRREGEADLDVPPLPPPEMAREPLMLRVITRAATRVTVACDGKVRFDAELPEARPLALFCRSDVRLSTQDAGATLLSVDGHACLPLGPAGRALNGFLLERERVGELCPPDRRES